MLTCCFNKVLYPLASLNWSKLVPYNWIFPGDTVTLQLLSSIMCMFMQHFYYYWLISIRNMWHLSSVWVLFIFNLNQPIKWFLSNHTRLAVLGQNISIHLNGSSCQRLCVQYGSQYSRDCLSCMKSIQHSLPSCFRYQMSQIKTLGAKQELAQ